VAIVAAAALVLLATVPAYGSTAFSIDSSKSFITIGELIDASAAFALPPGTVVYSTAPQFPDPDGAGPITGSDTTALYGGFDVDITGTVLGGGTITPLGGSISWAINNTPGVAGVPGLYVPDDPYPIPGGDPPFPPVGAQPGSNYGMLSLIPPGFPDLVLRQVYYDLVAAWLGPTRPMAAGGVFPMVPGLPLAGDGLIGVYSGRLAYTSFLGADSGDTVGDPLALMGTAGATPGTLALGGGPLGLTITIPIESAYTVTLDADPGPGVTPIPVTFTASGVIVAVAVPEPSTIALLGCGVVGLVACGLRLRKRKV
jgi:hypothetical protein